MSNDKKAPDMKADLSKFEARLADAAAEIAELKRQNAGLKSANSRLKASRDTPPPPAEMTPQQQSDLINVLIHNPQFRAMVSAHGDRTTQRGISLDEIRAHSDPNIEVVPPRDYLTRVDLEQFMQEDVQIVVQPGRREEQPYITPTVCGRRSVIVRGVPTWVKRYVVEVLARTRTTEYDQRANAFNPADIEMIPHTGLSYPFQVLSDPSPIGKTWLTDILNEPTQ